jgi:hypothetical protein
MPQVRRKVRRESQLGFQDVDQEDDLLAGQQYVHIGNGAGEIIALAASILPLPKGYIHKPE